MKILNFGSLNYDYVYDVEHIVQPGETISSSALHVACGGKGLNQSVALARAGAHVFHAGLVGNDGGTLLSVCDENQIDRTFIQQSDIRTGNAIIQVDSRGQNSIVLFGGANQTNTVEFIERVFSHFGAEDVLLLQNEVNLLSELIDSADQRGMKIVLNPSPFDEKVKKCDLSKVSAFIFNETEGAQLTGRYESDEILLEMLRLYPHAQLVLTLGKQGAVYRDSKNEYRHGTYDVEVVDTTAAGDTFTGYFFASAFNGNDIPKALQFASAASSLAVSRKGAIPSIPYLQEVLDFHK